MGDDGDSLATLGAYLAERGAWRLARGILTRARENGGEVDLVHLGRCAREAGDEDAAREAFTGAANRSGMAGCALRALDRRR